MHKILGILAMLYLQFIFRHSTFFNISSHTRDFSSQFDLRFDAYECKLPLYHTLLRGLTYKMLGSTDENVDCNQ